MNTVEGKIQRNPGKVIRHIVSWLGDYCEKAGMNGFVIGISGGIDSALTSTLCAKTGKKVLCLNLPIYQHSPEYERGTRHIEWLKKRFKNVSSFNLDLSELFKKTEGTFPKEIQDGLTMANTRSRLRMLTLYAFAGNKKMLVAGTGNKVEDFGVGFFTKYGDGGVDLSPIAGLMKSEVFFLAGKLGINKDILSAAPTDGLWANPKTDEEQIGASYDELEWAMAFLNRNTEKKEKKLSGRQKEVLAIFKKFNRANKHKMVAVPVCEIPKKFRS